MKQYITKTKREDLHFHPFSELVQKNQLLVVLHQERMKTMMIRPKYKTILLENETGPIRLF